MIELNKNQLIILISVFTLIIIVIVYYIWDTTQGSSSEIIYEAEEISSNSIEKEKIISNTEIIVHVAGAVENEGIQKLPENSRIADAIEAAGGLTSDANKKNINLAQKISDGQKIYIPASNEEEIIIQGEENTLQEMESSTAFSANNGTINLNQATQTELETLPGIGPSTASSIVSYRNENGKFKSIEDILNVSGVGESKYAQIKDKISI